MSAIQSVFLKPRKRTQVRREFHFWYAVLQSRFLCPCFQGFAMKYLRVIFIRVVQSRRFLKIIQYFFDRIMFFGTF